MDHFKYIQVFLLTITLTYVNNKADIPLTEYIWHILTKSFSHNFVSLLAYFIS